MDMTNRDLQIWLLKTDENDSKLPKGTLTKNDLRSTVMPGGDHGGMVVIFKGGRAKVDEDNLSIP